MWKNEGHRQLLQMVIAHKVKLTLVYRTRAVAAGQVSAVSIQLAFSSLMIAWRRQLAPRLGGRPTRTQRALGDDMLKFARWSRKLTAVSQPSSEKHRFGPKIISDWINLNLWWRARFALAVACWRYHNWLSNPTTSNHPRALRALSQCLLVLEILATHLMFVIFFTVLFLTIKAWLLTSIIIPYGNYCKCRWANAVSGTRYEYSKCFIRLLVWIIHYHNIWGAPGHGAPTRSITRKKIYLHRRCHWNIICWCRTCKTISAKVLKLTLYMLINSIRSLVSTCCYIGSKGDYEILSNSTCQSCFQLNAHHQWLSLCGINGTTWKMYL